MGDDDFEELELTPELAVALLATSRQEAVGYTKLIELFGTFDKLAGTVIHLSENGMLLDGHHRCTLVALTGRSLRVRVARWNYLIEWDLQVREGTCLMPGHRAGVMRLHPRDVRVAGVARDDRDREQCPEGSHSPC